jgi:hypothetical protein
LTSIEQYEEWIESGFILQILAIEPTESDERQRNVAAFAWRDAVEKTLYDFLAIPRLLIKERVLNLGFNAGWEWAWYCTEGVAEAYRRAGLANLYGKRLPTPLTELKRVLDGRFRVLGMWGQAETRNSKPGTVNRTGEKNERDNGRSGSAQLPGVDIEAAGARSCARGRRRTGTRPGDARKSRRTGERGSTTGIGGARA